MYATLTDNASNVGVTTKVLKILLHFWIESRWSSWTIKIKLCNLQFWIENCVTENVRISRWKIKTLITMVVYKFDFLDTFWLKEKLTNKQSTLIIKCISIKNAFWIWQLIILRWQKFKICCQMCWSKLFAWVWSR